jgi:hypothetical protein
VRVVQAFRRERRTLDDYRPRSRAQIGAWRSALVNIRPFTMIPLAQTTALVAVLLTAASMYRNGRSARDDRRLRPLSRAAVRPDRAVQRVVGEFARLAALGKVVGLLQVEAKTRSGPGRSSRTTVASSSAT